MEKKQNKIRSFFYWGLTMSLVSLYLVSSADEMIIQANESRSSHMGLFDGETTFSLSSDTGILPTLEIETKDVYGNVETYESDIDEMVVSKTEGGRTLKSVVLRGSTLINLFDKHTNDTHYGRNTVSIVEEDGSVTSKGTWFSSFRIDLKSLTKHTIFIKYVNGGRFLVLNDYIDHNGAVLLNTAWQEAGVEGVFTFNSSENGSINGLLLYASDEGKTYKDILILEGDYSERDIPYFEGSQSALNPTLTISNEDNSQIATITIQEEIVLRSNGDIYDELDLMTGKFTQRVDVDGNILDEEIIRYVKINSTHTFEQNKNADISVVGNITPILGSITVPSDPLSFTLNPNLEEGQQFIAPTFSISNDSQAPIGLEVKTFEQTTNLLNDVLPDKYDPWEGLTKAQSRDIALALEPQSSDSWISLNEGSYYVANTSDVELGQIKGNSTVDFKFSALHGQSFTETLNPQYKLTFIFEL